MIKNRIIRALCIISAIFFVACSDGDNKNRADKDSGKIKDDFHRNVKTSKAVLSAHNEELTLTGKVDYDPDKVINYVSLVNGIADHTYFSLGDKVQKGQTLVDLRSSDLSEVQSEAVAAESEVKTAQREYQTAQSMFEDNLLSEQELLEAQAKLKQAQANYNKTQSDISVHGISKGNGTFSIKSPMTGYVVAKNVSSGSTVSTEGEPLFTVADLSSVWIVANVYAGNLQSVKEGMDVDIVILSYPGEVFKGKINSLSPIFDPEEKVLKARIVMDNKDLKFKPEMSAVIKLKNETGFQSVSIPSDALIFDDNHYFVVTEDAPNEYAIKAVEVQGHSDKTTYISSGLKEGDNVVTKNQLLIYSGLKDN